VRAELTARDRLWADYVATWRLYCRGRAPAWALATMSELWMQANGR
jgi:hypothetical protein